MLVVIGLFLATLIAIAFSTVHIKTRNRPAGYLASDELFDDGGPCIDSIRSELYQKTDETIKEKIVPKIVQFTLSDTPNPRPDQLFKVSQNGSHLVNEAERNLIIRRLDSGFTYGDFHCVKASQVPKGDSYYPNGIDLHFYLRKRVKRRQRGELTEVE